MTKRDFQRGSNLGADDHVLDQYQALRFMMAGRARFTLRSLKTGKHISYRVNQSKDGQVWFVRSQGEYLGMIKSGRFQLTRKSALPTDDEKVVAFRWAFNHLLNHSLPEDQMEFWHEGTCGRCGRALTDPESIARGIGPVCAEKMGIV